MQSSRAVDTFAPQDAASQKTEYLERRSFWQGVLDDARSELSQEQDTKQLAIEAQKLEIKLREMEASAKAAQEIAIARRIESAERVEIEEYYDTTGTANLGLSADSTIKLGVSGSGRLVSRRIVRFHGGLAS